MTRLAIIFGGKSIEHEFSLKSAVSVLTSIDREKYEIIMIGITKEGKWLLYDGPIDMIESGEWRDYAELRLLAEPEKYNLQVLTTSSTLKKIADVAFPVLHGPKGEDGAIQGTFETIGIPCVGCSVLGSALAMDKDLTKVVLRQAGISVCDWKTYYREEIEDNEAKVMAEIEDSFGYPLFVKPACYGASIGVNKVKNKDELKAALWEVAGLDRKILVEEAVDCREIEVGIIGNTVPLASAVGEITYPGEYYDYETKFAKEVKVERTIPANISSDISAKAKEIAIKSYRALNLNGFARVDFFMDKDSGTIYVNEINSIPAFGDNSMFSQLWSAMGLEYTELLDRLVGYALEEQ